MAHTKIYVGKFVRFGPLGVGCVDVPELTSFLYFNPRHINNYHGETLKELAKAPFGFKPGCSVEITVDEEGLTHTVKTCG